MTPLYRELHTFWRTHKDPEVRRLALDIQYGRYAISEISALVAEEHFRANKPRAELADAQKALGRIRHRLLQELARIGPIKGKS